MSKKIFFSDGGKGGVGKSMVSICLIDYFITQGENVAIVDSDVTNPDVSRIFKDHPQCAVSLYDLKEKSDRMHFLESLENLHESVETVIVNLPAAIDLMDKFEGGAGMFKMLGFETFVLFSINRHADSVNLLGKSLIGGLLNLADNKVIVLNGMSGLPEGFHRFNESDVKEEIFNQQGKILYLPELFWKSVDICLLELNKTFSEAIKGNMSVVYRYQTQQWISDVHDRLDKVLTESKTPTFQPNLKDVPPREVEQGGIDQKNSDKTKQ